MLTTHKTTVVRSRIESDLKNCATEVLPFEIRTPNATTLAAMKEARSMGKAKFDFAPALALMPIYSNSLIASIDYRKPGSKGFGLIVFIVLLFVITQPAQAEGVGASCTSPAIIAPRLGILYESRPLIEWAKVPGALQYRVQVRSQVPEGKVVATIDTVVSENRFSAPQPLAESRAIVTVKVSTLCGPMESVPSVLRFELDVTRECPAPRGVKASANDGKLLVVWNPRESVEGYRVVLRSASNGAELERRETTNARASFDGGKYFNTLLMLAIESRCRHVVGDALVLPISVSP